jgi:hypothetical protein
LAALITCNNTFGECKIVHLIYPVMYGSAVRMQDKEYIMDMQRIGE